MKSDSHDERRFAIRDLIRQKRIATQEELRQLLRRQGFEVTQATLSRDLARLGARRVALPEGGTVYEVEEGKPANGLEALAAYREMVLSLKDTDALVVVHTSSGAASAVASGLDRSRLPEIEGTLAGDDTIFIAPTRGTTPTKLLKTLRDLWMRGGPLQ